MRTRLDATKKRHYRVYFADISDEKTIENIYEEAERLQAAINLTKLEATGKLMFDLHWDTKE